MELASSGRAWVHWTSEHGPIHIFLVNPLSDCRLSMIYLWLCDGVEGRDFCAVCCGLLNAFLHLIRHMPRGYSDQCIKIMKETNPMRKFVLATFLSQVKPESTINLARSPAHTWFSDQRGFNKNTWRSGGISKQNFWSYMSPKSVFLLLILHVLLLYKFASAFPLPNE